MRSIVLECRALVGLFLASHSQMVLQMPGLPAILMRLAPSPHRRRRLMPGWRSHTPSSAR